MAARGNDASPSRATFQPLVLNQRTVPISPDSEQWRRLRILIWVFVGPLFLTVALPSLVTFGIPSSLLAYFVEFIQSGWFLRLAPIIGASIFLGITSWIIGSDGRQVVRQRIRMPGPKYLLLGLSVPIGISVLISSGDYVIDRVQRAAHDFGQYSPPQFGSYFSFPDPWLLILFFAAFSGEVIFRGLLQPEFIQRYGTYRGIFFVSMVWAAFHFSSDSYSGASDFGVLRILLCEYLYAWHWALFWRGLRCAQLPLFRLLSLTLSPTYLSFQTLGRPFLGKTNCAPCFGQGWRMFCSDTGQFRQPMVQKRQRRSQIQNLPFDQGVAQAIPRTSWSPHGEWSRYNKTGGRAG
jgi:membrane protease YdiL (CAAX protease family)